VSVVQDKKNARIEADKYAYGIIDLLVILDKKFRRNEEMQAMGRRIKKVLHMEEVEPTKRELQVRNHLRRKHTKDLG